MVLGGRGGGGNLINQQQVNNTSTRMYIYVILLHRNLMAQSGLRTECNIKYMSCVPIYSCHNIHVSEIYLKCLIYDT